MGNLVAKMAVAMLKRAVTEKFMARIFVLIGWEIAQMTTFTKLDDKGVEALADSLGVTNYK